MTWILVAFQNQVTRMVNRFIQRKASRKSRVAFGSDFQSDPFDFAVVRRLLTTGPMTYALASGVLRLSKILCVCVIALSSMTATPLSRRLVTISLSLPRARRVTSALRTLRPLNRKKTMRRCSWRNPSTG